MLDAAPRPAHPGAPHPGALGILYAEDFGQPAGPASPPPPPPPVQPAPPPGPTQADIDAACIRAVRAAEAAWAASAEERRAEALQALAARVAEARHAAAHHAEAVADGLVRTVLAMVAGALPHWARAHGDAEVRALVGRLAPLLARSERLTIRVHPGLIDVLAADLAGLDDHAGSVELRPANLPPGDVRLAWQDGGIVRDTASLVAAVTDALDRFGLGNPVAPPPHHPDLQNEALEHAQ